MTVVWMFCLSRNSYTNTHITGVFSPLLEQLFPFQIFGSMHSQLFSQSGEVYGHEIGLPKSVCQFCYALWGRVWRRWQSLMHINPTSSFTFDRPRQDKNSIRARSGCAQTVQRILIPHKKGEPDPARPPQDPAQAPAPTSGRWPPFRSSGAVAIIFNPAVARHHRPRYFAAPAVDQALQRVMGIHLRFRVACENP